MKILGIHDGHNASACLLEDGKIKWAIQEERLTNEKNRGGFPEKAVKKILELENLAPEGIDYVTMASRSTPFGSSREQRVKDFRKSKSFFRKVKEILRETPAYDVHVMIQQRRRIRNLKNLGFSGKQIVFVDHHLCHAATAYFGSPWRKKVLVLTNDGRGDMLCASVWIGNNGNLEKISETEEGNSVGEIYAKTTFLLGFVPLEHEYKLMGMSPYVKSEKRIEQAYEIYRNYLHIDGTKIKRDIDEKTHMILPRLKADLEYMRFDWICAGLQKFTEQVLIEWVKNCIKKTGIKRVCMAGGVFMNVKANKAISELKEVKEMFIFPSCGDESISIGAAYWIYHTKTGKSIEPIGSIYYGPSFENSDAEKVLKKEKYKYKKSKDIEKEVAKLVAKGEIVARCKGRLEFGARALGNRSILADPIKRDVVRIINDMIKNRDFWMPFAPSMLKERERDYIINPKKIESPYMIMAFDTTKNREEMFAGMHPSDFTARPQVVTKEHNPEYHKILKEFERLTGRGVVLNTSFNLHGYPIVYGPEEALWVFKNSGLKYLALGDYLVWK